MHRRGRRAVGAILVGMAAFGISSAKPIVEPKAARAEAVALADTLPRVTLDRDCVKQKLCGKNRSQNSTHLFNAVDGGIWMTGNSGRLISYPRGWSPKQGSSIAIAATDQLLFAYSPLERKFFVYNLGSSRTTVIEDSAPPGGGCAAAAFGCTVAYTNESQGAIKVFDASPGISKGGFTRELNVEKPVIALTATHFWYTGEGEDKVYFQAYGADRGRIRALGEAKKISLKPILKQEGMEKLASPRISAGNSGDVYLYAGGTHVWVLNEGGIAGKIFIGDKRLLAELEGRRPSPSS